MDNQHRQIKGYRELSQEEVDLMNKIKQKGVELSELVEEAREFNTNLFQELTSKITDHQTKVSVLTDEELEQVGSRREVLIESEAPRWINIARTHFQEGLMALTRSVAQPTFF